MKLWRRLVFVPFNFCAFASVAACGFSQAVNDASKTRSEGIRAFAASVVEPESVAQDGPAAAPYVSPMSRYQALLRESVGRSHDARRRGQRPDRSQSLSMAVFGDSLGAATFAGTVMGQPLKIGDVWRVLRAISLQYVFPQDDAKYLERIKNVVGYERFNGFSGSEPWSHRQRIAEGVHFEVPAFNYAIPGARTDHLRAQVAAFSRDFSYSANAPAYIAVSVGGNDFCDAFPVEKAVQSLYESIRDIRAVLPQSLILISGIPDVVSVFDDYSRVAFEVGGFSMTCRARAELFPMCARELDLVSGDPERVATAKQDLLRYQGSFAELARRLEEDFPQEGPVRYAPLPQLSEEDGLLAADCFHPGVAGHQRIASATWRAVADAFRLER